MGRRIAHIAHCIDLNGRVIREQLTLFSPLAASPFKQPKSDCRKMPKSGSRREAVLRHILRSGRRGITDDELRAKLPGLSNKQVIKTRLELLEGGFIMDSTCRRTTPFDDPAIVWRSTDYGQQLWRQSKRR